MTPRTSLATPRSPSLARGHVRRVASAAHALLWIAVLTMFACTNAPSGEDVGKTSSAVFVNGGFEVGAANTRPGAPWVVQTFLNPGITVQSPQTLAGLNLAPGGVARTFILNSPLGPGSQPDASLGPAASLRWPRYGNQCVLVNQLGNNRNVNTLAQTMTVAAGDIDPSDGQVHMRFTVAPVLQNPAHAANQQPYYFVLLTNVTRNTILYSDFNLSGAGIPWKTVNAGTPNEIDYTDWQLVDIAPGNGGVAIGDSVKLEIIGSGCSLGAHFGEIYVDGVGATVPGISVQGTGPAQANAGTNITYRLTYRNGGAAAATGVTVSLTTPPNTTYQSINAGGLVCVTPPVNTAGTLTCTVGNLAAGASGSFTVTVNINAGTTGTIVEGSYQIQSTQETPLIGPRIVTICGCTQDSDCTAGNWCNEAARNCTPTLANGTPMPSDPPHVNPTLNGACTAQAGALVCTSAVCDTDNRCGLLNNDGPCTAANGGVVCRSGVCDPDGRCGYAVGDGPCTVANGGVVCRSGACSTNGFCEPAGGCNVDADCSGGNWCRESTHTCTPKIANGGAMPSDPPHTSPTLNGVCTAQAATLVCVSGVCDTDNKCGYAVGDGPCTPANGGVVCRSGACSVNNTCEPFGGCDVDADCSGGNWCNESIHTCSPKIANGGALPTDPPHVGPTLNGVCSAQAGALVCVSGVCDGGVCGIKLGDGTCATTSQCITGVCVTVGPNAGKCELCAGNGDCAAPTAVCDTTKNVCVQCTPGNASACIGTTPVCSAAETCVPCNGDNGTVSSAGCPTPGNPYCAANGACTKCTGDADCTTGTHPGPFCNTTTGACGTICQNDAECGAGNWCNNVTTAGTCQPKVPNGQPVPGGTCTALLGTRACATTVCDTNDNLCGYRNGDGPCTAATQAECRSTICATVGPNAGKCEQCNGDGNCSSPTPACDPTTNVCVQCTPANSTACTGTTPICSAAETCVPCNGDNGSSGTNACPATNPYCAASGACTKCTSNGDCTTGTHGGPICNTTTGGCGNTCFVDTDCANNQWCSQGSCTPKLPNGTPLPNVTPINGLCTAGNGARVCLSGVCDTDNACGYKNGDGPCATGTVCRSTVCATTGANAGKCEPCIDDSTCSGGTAVCDTTKNACVQCTPAKATACTGTTPVCDPGSETCVPCTGDFGEPGATDPCGTVGQPWCELVGPTKGTCGKCQTNVDCQGHPLGAVCDPNSGACGMACRADSDCNTATQWCNAPQGGSGSCVPKLTNGTPLPSAPPDVTTCTASVGARVCVSGACDPKDNKCGLVNGDGPCTPANGATVCRSGACDGKDDKCGYINGDGPCAGPPQCRSTRCNPQSICAECFVDPDCPAGDFCKAGTCTPKLGNGQSCTQPSQCIANICDTDNACGGLPGTSCSDGPQCRAGACTNERCGSPTSPDGGAANDDTGTLAGGGFGCSTAPGGSSGNGVLLWGLAVGLGAVAARGRRTKR